MGDGNLEERSSFPHSLRLPEILGTILLSLLPINKMFVSLGCTEHKYFTDTIVMGSTEE